VHGAGCTEFGFILLGYGRRSDRSDTEQKSALRSIVDVWTEWQCPSVLGGEAVAALAGSRE
jgi:hypothetical protein